VTVSRSHSNRSAEFLAKKKNVESPRLQAELLLAHVSPTPAHANSTSSSSAPWPRRKWDDLRELVRRRGDREPLQHIIGSTCFCGLENRRQPPCAHSPPRNRTPRRGPDGIFFQTLNPQPSNRPSTSAPAPACLAVTLAVKMPRRHRCLPSIFSPDAPRPSPVKNAHAPSRRVPALQFFHRRRLCAPAVRHPFLTSLFPTRLTFPPPRLTPSNRRLARPRPANRPWMAAADGLDFFTAAWRAKAGGFFEPRRPAHARIRRRPGDVFSQKIFTQTKVGCRKRSSPITIGGQES